MSDPPDVAQHLVEGQNFNKLQATSYKLQATSRKQQETKGLTMDLI